MTAFPRVEPGMLQALELALEECPNMDATL